MIQRDESAIAFGLAFRGAAPPAASLWSPVFAVGPLVLALLLIVPIEVHARRSGSPSVRRNR